MEIKLDLAHLRDLVRNGSIQIYPTAATAVKLTVDTEGADPFTKLYPDVIDELAEADRNFVHGWYSGGKYHGMLPVPGTSAWFGWVLGNADRIFVGEIPLNECAEDTQRRVILGLLERSEQPEIRRDVK